MKPPNGPQQKAADSSEAKKEGVTKLLVVFSSGVEIDRPGADRNNRYREPEKVSDVLSLFHLYALRVGEDAQRANGKKSDSKPEERISKRHSLPPPSEAEIYR